MLKQYIVSGSNGYLGEKVVSILANQGEKVIGLCRKVPGQKNEQVSYVTNEKFLANSSTYMDRDTIFIHLAFARGNRGAGEIANSLDFTKEILNKLSISDNLKKFIYISSQGIYGKSSKIRMVGDQAEPESLYTMAKYAAEKMVESSFKNYCILRLDNVIQSQNLVKSLAKSAIREKKIYIVGGKQIFSYIDGEDAATAITICAQSEENHEYIYNVGPNKMQVSLLDIADILKQVAAYHQNEIEVLIEPDSTELWAGLDTKKFCDEYHWKPKYNINQMIDRVYESVLKEG